MDDSGYNARGFPFAPGAAKARQIRHSLGKAKEIHG
jgi:hypothetical protein